MDPHETLRQLLRLLAGPCGFEHAERKQEIRWKLQDLDRWIGDGGYLPRLPEKLPVAMKDGPVRS